MSCASACVSGSVVQRHVPGVVIAFGIDQQTLTIWRADFDGINDAYTAVFARKPGRGCKEVAGKGIKFGRGQFDNLLDPRRLRSRFRSARV